MTYKELKNKIKEEQKTLAQQIKRGKSIRKPKDRINISEQDRGLYYGHWGESDGFCYWKVTGLSDYYRHLHIAYCMFFNNTPYEHIEQPRDDNKPRKSRLDQIKKEWQGLLDEALRDCA